MNHLFVQLVNTTNPNFTYMIGWKGQLSYKLDCSAYLDTLTGYLYTSIVRQIDITDSTITLTTMNSVYSFFIITEEEARRL